MTGRCAFPLDRPVVLDERVQVRDDAAVLLGGAPWGVIRITESARPFLRLLAQSGRSGSCPATPTERSLVEVLLARGFVYPAPVHHDHDGLGFDIVVPAYERPGLLDTCLASLRACSPAARIIVVDDASTDPTVGDVARAHGAILLRHAVNRGPAAARNSGLRASTSPLVAFVDADCAVTPGWLSPLAAHFDDARVCCVGPRIRPRSGSQGLMARYEDSRSALDMGRRPELVTPGAPLSYLPSATLLIRRAALGDNTFDEKLRVGEDVDLVWRLVDQGWLVRYEPASVVTHEIRPTVRAWVRQIFSYGTSAAVLEGKHPQRLRPARVSGWNAAVAALALSRPLTPTTRILGGLGVAGIATALLARSLRAARVDPRLAFLLVGKGLRSDATAAGHVLRRECWPIGWLALMAAGRYPLGRVAAAIMLGPLVMEWIVERPRIDLPRYLALRLVEDATYGSGAIAGAVEFRRGAVLIPQIRLPHLRRTAKAGGDDQRRTHVTCPSNSFGIRRILGLWCRRRRGGF